LASIVELSTPIGSPLMKPCSQTLQHPGKDLVVQLEPQARAGAAQPGMVGYRLALAQPQELATRHTVRTPPFQPALAVDPFELAAILFTLRCV
jgi:hypothetical protein